MKSISPKCYTDTVKNDHHHPSWQITSILYSLKDEEASFIILFLSLSTNSLKRPWPWVCLSLSISFQSYTAPGPFVPTADVNLWRRTNQRFHINNEKKDCVMWKGSLVVTNPEYYLRTMQFLSARWSSSRILASLNSFFFLIMEQFAARETRL